ncbi:MarR family transcriptional regulator [Phenylobacterium sp. J426]|uniref:MarR family winged helix-turn-helix transcriptional regulator n=1 Tax=Phenylobacterium sp. J426 TaxID=2898439 RepID=UPI002150F92A|nr:MarR family transcriptional regulator [Phenylobacterium sp. J426]MCR5874134.1 MarR family transcriptional regulator [Phenylobacterium sp. J426]
MQSKADTEPHTIDGGARVFFLLFQMMERRNRVIEDILRPHGLTLQQWRILLGLGWLKVRTMHEVADALAIDRTALSRAADKLAERGLLTRSEVAYDRRLTELALTTEGMAVRCEVLLQVRELGARLLAGIEPDAVAAAEELAEGVLERLVGHRAGARRIIEMHPAPPSRR